jgi:diacylglycerol kinase family enzyme
MGSTMHATPATPGSDLTARAPWRFRIAAVLALVVGALDAFTDGVECRIDLARVNDRVFVNNASLGVYAKVVQSEAYRDAKLETWTDMLPDLLGPDAEPVDLEFTAADGSRCADAPLVLVSNNPYRLTSLAGAGTRERIDTGQLGVLAARVRSAADVSKLVALELVGQAGRFPGLLSWSAQEFEVRSGGPVEVGLDGEALVLDPPLPCASRRCQGRYAFGYPARSASRRALALRR